jgi:CheY-like chemotaxis protein
MNGRESADAHHVLVADDEPDIHAITKLSLKGLQQGGRRVELFSASSGREAIEMMRARPEIAVVLLDVVMESDSAGLDACRAIREDLQNRFVRILLRTGQPGAAPERQTIDTYDIDGYLPKADLTASKLYTAIRTALKAHGELMRLERHRRQLTLLHDCVLSLHSFAPLEEMLRKIISTIVAIAPTPLAALYLEAVEHDGDRKRFFLHQGSSRDAAAGSEIAAEALRASVAQAATSGRPLETGRFGEGYLARLELHRGLGHGWIYVEGSEIDEVTKKTLSMLAAHTANSVYACLAQAILANREGPVFEAVSI